MCNVDNEQHFHKQKCVCVRTSKRPQVAAVVLGFNVAEEY